MESFFQLWTSFFLSLSALLPLVNPVGSALVFLGLVGDESEAVYRLLARKIAVSTLGFLAIIELVGSTLLNFFGISLPVVQVAGGLVISAMAWSLLNERDASANARTKQEEINASTALDDSAWEQKVFYPFTFPITAGPGTLVVMLTLSARFSTHGLTGNVLGHIGIFLAVILLSICVYFCYAFAPRLSKIMPPATAHGILRVIAFILMCIGVQIAWNGFSQLLIPLLARRG